MKASPYFSHDYGARNDPKMQKLLMRLGQEGKGVFWDVVEIMYEQNGFVSTADCEGIAFALRTDLKTLLRILSDEFNLFQTDGEKYWSESILRRLEKRECKSDKARNSAEARWRNKQRKTEPCERIEDSCERIATAIKNDASKEKKSTVQERIKEVPPIYPPKENLLDAQNMLQEVDKKVSKHKLSGNHVSNENGSIDESECFIDEMKKLNEFIKNAFIEFHNLKGFQLIQTPSENAKLKIQSALKSLSVAQLIDIWKRYLMRSDKKIVDAGWNLNFFPHMIDKLRPEMIQAQKAASVYNEPETKEWYEGIEGMPETPTLSAKVLHEDMPDYVWPPKDIIEFWWISKEDADKYFKIDWSQEQLEAWEKNKETRNYQES